jgi:hypothetical protein
MSQLDLSEDTMIFYKAMRGVTIGMVMYGTVDVLWEVAPPDPNGDTTRLIVAATLIIAFHQSELDAAQALKAERDPPEKRKEPPGTTLPKVAYSVWEEMAMHPSNAISTWAVKPRL